MNKIYQRKQVSSLEQLDREQERIRRKIRNIEDDWASAIDPQQIAVSFLSGWVRGKLNKRTAANNVKNTPTANPQRVRSLLGIKERYISPSAATRKSGKKSNWTKLLRFAGLSALKVAVVDVAILSTKKLIGRAKKKRPKKRLKNK
ncbi:MAG: hypothetical protein QM642_05510 [Edaphocola sp.]